MSGLVQDVRYALRSLRSTPGFTSVAVLTLALGMGASIAMFSVVNAVVLRPLPYPNGDRLVRIWESNPRIGRPTASVSYPNFLDWRAQTNAFEALAAIEGDSFTMASNEGAEIVLGANVTADFLSVLGVSPVLGRNFLRHEDEAGGTRMAIISDGFWKRRFGARPDILSQRIRLDGDEFTIIGILPAGFSTTTPRCSPLRLMPIRSDLAGIIC